jgi:protein BCP1
MSRVYHLSEEEESALANSAVNRRGHAGSSGSGNSPKKAKKMKPQDQATMGRPQDGIYSFHPEDIILAKVENLLH